tara:strand:- start:242 stop:1450 length:1209 start_codon:yes stop_codon:yes gene_type:complete
MAPSAPQRLWRSDALLLAASQAARLAGPGLALIYLASAWPPAAFGRFVTIYAFASLLALLPAVGLSAYLLDRSARAPRHARAMLRQALLVLAGFAIIATAVAWTAIGVSADFEAPLVLTLLVAMLLAGACEVTIASLRAQRQERAVALLAVPANAALLGFAFFTAASGPLTVALAWLIIRAVQATLLIVTTWRLLPEGEARPPPLRSALPFFASQSAGIAYGQADTLLVHALLGEVAAGLYNAALRLLQLASFAAQALAQWFQPRLASLAVASPEWQAQRRRLHFCLGAIAFGGFAAFTLFGHIGIGLLFGPAYAGAVPILQLAGAVLLARCLVAGLWIELTARLLELHRARDAWLLLLLFAALAWPLAAIQGPVGVMLAHLLALGPIAAFSARSLARARQV